ncbi:mitochondrial ATP synthase epsilon chain domain-containing protein [Sarocladium implicatum]|nr:mitochondrial ATP synthase epsilon chain domain-containing protein [Sarocladium implicatum]
MTAAWKAAGLTYNRFLAISARTIRRSLKEDKRILAERRGEMELRFARWENGKQGEPKDLGKANLEAMAEQASS